MAVLKVATAGELREAIRDAVHGHRWSTPLPLRELGVVIRSRFNHAIPDKWILEEVWKMHDAGQVWVDKAGLMPVWHEAPRHVREYPGSYSWVTLERGIVVYPRRPAWKDRECGR